MALTKIYAANNLSTKMTNQTGRSSNERISNESSQRVPMNNRIPSGKSRQQVIRAKTKIYANRNILGNSSIVTPSSQIGSTKNATKMVDVQGGLIS